MQSTRIQRLHSLKKKKREERKKKDERKGK
jgi:hypothetical protein